jgi:hypothetical protein
VGGAAPTNTPLTLMVSNGNLVRLLHGYVVKAICLKLLDLWSVICSRELCMTFSSGECEVKILALISEQGIKLLGLLGPSAIDVRGLRVLRTFVVSNAIEGRSTGTQVERCDW